MVYDATYTVCPHCKNPQARFGPEGIICPTCQPVAHWRLFGTQQQKQTDPTVGQLKKAYEAGAAPDIAKLARPETPPVERRPPMVTGVKIMHWQPETKELDLRIKFE